MLNVFTLAQGRLIQQEIDGASALAGLSPVWVDLEAPTPEEKGWVAGRFGVSIPDNIVDDDLEESARLLRAGQRRAAHPLRLPDRRRPDPAQRARGLHPA